MPNEKASPAHRLAYRLESILASSKVDADEITKILIDLLAHHIAGYEPIHREYIWDAAVDELDDMVEIFSAIEDEDYQKN
jgi:hypothetical protein